MMKTTVKNGEKGGKIVTIFIENADLVHMKKRDENGFPLYLKTVPPVPTLLEELIVTRILPEEIQEIQDMEKMAKENRRRAERIRGLSPCCGNKLLREDGDPDGIKTCSQCGRKYKNVGGVWFNAETDVKLEIVSRSAEAKDNKEDEQPEHG